MPDQGGASGQMGHVERRELGAMLEPAGQRAEAEEESRETPAMVTLEDGSPVELTPH